MKRARELKGEGEEGGLIMGKGRGEREGTGIYDASQEHHLTRIEFTLLTKSDGESPEVSFIIASTNSSMETCAF